MSNFINNYRNVTAILKERQHAKNGKTLNGALGRGEGSHERDALNYENQNTCVQNVNRGGRKENSAFE